MPAASIAEILPPLPSANRPAPATEAAILRIVCRNYPGVGDQMEAAVRMALRLGWAARHESEGIPDPGPLPHARCAR